MSVKRKDVCVIFQRDEDNNITILGAVPNSTIANSYCQYLQDMSDVNDMVEYDYESFEMIGW